MPQVKVCPRLEGMGEQQDLLLAEQLARQMHRGRRALRETGRNAQHGMAGAIRDRLVAADEEIEIAERFIDLLHHAHAKPVRLNELDGRNEMSGPNLVRPPALFGSLLNLCQHSRTSRVGK